MAKKTEFNMAVVKKYLFWACTPLGLIAAVVTGWLAIGSVADDLDKQKKQLESQKSSIATLLSGAARHPNQGTIDEINAETVKLTENVFTAWETMEKKQAEKNVWRGLSIGAFQDINSKDFLDQLDGSTLESYLTFARDGINKLLDEPDNDIRHVCVRDREGKRFEPLELATSTGGNTGRRQPGGGSSGGATTSRVAIPTDGSVTLRGKVAWDNPALDITMKDWTNRPQSFVVWLTQEDLWVYKALLWVVAESNKDSPERNKPVTSSGPRDSGTSGTRAGADPLDLSGSVVKEIVELLIGQKAAVELAKQSSRRIGLGSSSSSDMSSGSSSGSSTLGSSSSGSSDGSSSGASGALTQKTAMTGRYVDIDGKPIMDGDTAITGQYRRMPVYLRFRVDQRRISDILVNCANCPMPIDVLWVTINPGAVQSFEYASSTSSSTGSSSDSSSSSSSSSGGSFIQGPRPRPGAGGNTQGNQRPSAGRGDTDFGPDVVEIEIYGCINIFAPPDEKRIGGGT